MARKKAETAAEQEPQAPIRITCSNFVLKPVSEIIPYARNAKVHRQEQIRRLRASLREFGFVRPLLIDGSGNLIAGHGTLEAAVAEGMESVPCVLAEGLTDQQRRAYVIADNKLSELADWDMGTVNLELGELRDLGFDLTVTGFALEPLAEPEDAPEEAPVPESSTKTKKLVTCPECGCEFSPTKRRG